MKKIIYLVLFSICSSMAFVSCTEEEVVTPSTENGGGTGGTDKI